MEFVKKEELTLKNGYFVKGNKIIPVDPKVIKQFNHAETMFQMRKHLMEQPPAQPVPSLKDFSREHLEGSYTCYIDTPILDKKIERTKAFLKEKQEIRNCEIVNEYLDSYKEALEWLRNDEFITSDEYELVQLDTPVILKNVLTLEVETFLDFLKEYKVWEDISINCKISDKDTDKPTALEE